MTFLLLSCAVSWSPSSFMTLSRLANSAFDGVVDLNLLLLIFLVKILKTKFLFFLFLSFFGLEFKKRKIIIFSILKANTFKILKK